MLCNIWSNMCLFVQECKPYMFICHLCAGKESLIPTGQLLSHLKVKWNLVMRRNWETQFLISAGSTGLLKYLMWITDLHLGGKHSPSLCRSAADWIKPEEEAGYLAWRLQASENIHLANNTPTRRRIGLILLFTLPHSSSIHTWKTFIEKEKGKSLPSLGNRWHCSLCTWM